ncbi:UNVERIFIED_ORG: hypothetical protein M2442_000262 [Methylorubrum zatmanii]|nr:hypothetical protein [Methylorubrum zatmanii]
MLVRGPVAAHLQDPPDIEHRRRRGRAGIRSPESIEAGLEVAERPGGAAAIRIERPHLVGRDPEDPAVRRNPHPRIPPTIEVGTERVATGRTGQRAPARAGRVDFRRHRDVALGDRGGRPSKSVHDVGGAAARDEDAAIRQGQHRGVPALIRELRGGGRRRRGLRVEQGAGPRRVIVAHGTAAGDQHRARLKEGGRAAEAVDELCVRQGVVRGGIVEAPGRVPQVEGAPVMHVPAEGRAVCHDGAGGHQRRVDADQRPAPHRRPHPHHGCVGPDPEVVHERVRFVADGDLRERRTGHRHQDQGRHKPADTVKSEV